MPPDSSNIQYQSQSAANLKDILPDQIDRPIRVEGRFLTLHTAGKPHFVYLILLLTSLESPLIHFQACSWNIDSKAAEAQRGVAWQAYKNVNVFVMVLTLCIRQSINLDYFTLLDRVPIPKMEWTQARHGALHGFKLQTRLLLIL